MSNDLYTYLLSDLLASATFLWRCVVDLHYSLDHFRHLVCWCHRESEMELSSLDLALLSVFLLRFSFPQLDEFASVRLKSKLNEFD